MPGRARYAACAAGRSSDVPQRVIQLVLLREMQAQDRIELIEQAPDFLRAFQLDAVRGLVRGDARTHGWRTRSRRARVEVRAEASLPRAKCWAV